jgi:3-oxoacyl-[acyl-carrier protein] reductase
MSKKIVLVTGASSGIGLAICKRLISDGLFVIASGRNLNRLNTLRKSVVTPENMAIEVKDVTEGTSELNKWVHGLSKKYGKLDGAVLSSGVQNIQPIRAVMKRDFSEMFQINFEANFWIAKGFCDKRVNAGKNSSLIFISSISSICGEVGLASYSSSKGALNSLTKALSKEMGPQGVRVNAVLPGLIQTALLDKESSVYTSEYLAKEKGNYPLGLGIPEDISGVISFLLSNDSRWMTGVCLPVDGGYKS